MNIQQVVKNGLCIGCGGCTLLNDVSTMGESRKHGIFVPSPEVFTEHADICSGSGYPIQDIGREMYGETGQYNLELGYSHNIIAASSNSKNIKQKSSSGGIAFELAKYLLDVKRVKSIIATKIIYDGIKPRPQAVVITDPKDLFATQGSKYYSVNNLEVIKSLKSENLPAALIGTPCQIASLRLLQKKNIGLSNHVKFTIGLFCGGFKPFQHTDRIIRNLVEGNDNITHFQHRGDGQPGQLKIVTLDNTTYAIPYPDYETNTGYHKIRRCRLCVDATAELADVSIGDLWLSKYLKSNKQWSIVVQRNPEIKEMFMQMEEANTISTTNISVAEVIESQKTNITSKKYRHKSRVMAYRWLGIKYPKFDGGFNDDAQLNILLEFKILIKYRLTLILEKLGLYNFLIDIYRRINRTNKYRKKSWI
jgi:coenzyme F420 hydrogenase subunit beta